MTFRAPFLIQVNGVVSGTLSLMVHGPRGLANGTAASRAGDEECHAHYLIMLAVVQLFIDFLYALFQTLNLPIPPPPPALLVLVRSNSCCDSLGISRIFVIG